MPTLTTEHEVLGPWSLAVARAFWEGFAPSALPGAADDAFHVVFRVDGDWSRATAVVRQEGDVASVRVEGDGDLEAATDQVLRFLAIDVDATGWPAVGERDAVIGEAQRAMPGLRPCGFCSPYEAAVWSVLSQRTRIAQATRLRADLVLALGDGGALPDPETLEGADLDLPGRKPEYLRAVAQAALDGVLLGGALRAVEPEEAMRRVQAVQGLGPFAAELVVLRGANVPDALPTHEPRLRAEVERRYGAGASLEEAGQGWRPFRTWAAFHLRALTDDRTVTAGG